MATPRGGKESGSPASGPELADREPAGGSALGRRLRRALRPRRRQTSVAVLLALVGFAGVVQARSAGSGDLAGLRQSELVRILDDAETRAAQLREEQRTLQEEYDRLTTGSEAAREQGDEAARRATELGILAGTLPAAGPGVVLRIPDPSGQVRATGLLDAVQELRDAGAEALQIGSVRVVVSTAFEPAEGGVSVGGTVVRPPYELRAIGPAADLESALGIPGGVLESLEADGLRPTVEQVERLLVDALHG